MQAHLAGLIRAQCSRLRSASPRCGRPGL